jgi:DNA-binding transcriptional ArsR family regulator
MSIETGFLQARKEDKVRLSPKELVRVFRALSDPTRVEIVRLVARAPRNVSELTSLVQVSQPKVSRHLKILRDAGLLSDVRRGKWVWYEIARTGKDNPAGSAVEAVTGMLGGRMTPGAALTGASLTGHALVEAATGAASLKAGSARGARAQGAERGSWPEPTSRPRVEPRARPKVRRGPSPGTRPERRPEAESGPRRRPKKKEAPPARVHDLEDFLL